MAGSFLGGLGGFGSLGAGTLGEVLVKVGVDTKQLDAGLAKAEVDAKAAGTSVSQFGAYAKAGFAVAGVAALAFAKVAVQAASDQVESINKVGEVFDTSAKAVEDFASTTATGLGIAKTAALDAAANFGTLFESAGFATAAAAEMSTQFVTLAGDLASFFNISTGDALEKLRAGLAGQSRPLRELGIFLSQARIETEAYASGIAKVGSTLTDAQKVQARYNIILKDSKTAQGDFARTSDGLANQQRIMTAQWEDLKAELGTALLPVVIEVTHQFNNLLTVIAALASHHLPEAKSSVAALGDQLGNLASLLHLTSNPFADFVGKLIELKGATQKVDIQSVTYTGTLKELKSAVNDATGASDEAARAADKLATAHQKAADAAKAEKQAEQQLAGGLTAIIGSLQQLKTDQANLKKLQHDSSTSAGDLHTAELAVVNDFIQLKSNTADFNSTLGKTPETLAAAIRGLDAIARAAGLSKQQVQDLNAQLRAVPTDIHTNITVTKDGYVPNPQQLAGGYHGVVTRPTLFMAGEAGPERLDVGPANKSGNGNGNGSPGHTINIINPAGTPEQIAHAINRYARAAS